MNTYTAKTLEEALKLASEKEGCTIDELNYQVVEEKKGLFSKKVVIETYGIIDVITFSKEYLLNIISNYDLEGTVVEKFENGIIHLTIDTNHNSILIGKNGKTLQSLNELTRIAVSNHFKHRYRILIDINGYKDDKYDRLAKMSRRIAHEVQKTHMTVTLDPMPADERRIIHNTLTNMPHIKTESTGSGKQRQIQIIYVD